MQTLERTFVALGSFRDAEARVVRDAAAAAGIALRFVERPADLLAWLDVHEPLAVLVRTDTPGALAACVQVRNQARFAGVPILGASTDTSDLAFVELFSVGADDLVPLASAHALARRLRVLLTTAAPNTAPGRGVSGHALVAGTDAQWRTVMARALFNGGYAVSFVANADGAVEESRAQGTKLVVASDGLRPDGALAALATARRHGSQVPWVIVAPPKKLMATRAAAVSMGPVAVTDAFAPPENVLFVANELLSPRLGDLRASTRLLYGTQVAFRAAGRDDDEVGFTYNISSDGLYVRTLAPLNRGQEVWLDLWPPRSERRVRLAGEVAWARPFGRAVSATVPPGFGVRLTCGLGDDLQRFRDGYAAFAESLISGKVTAVRRAAAQPIEIAP